MADSYWANIVGRRISRRSALIATGGSAAAAAFLAACGGSSKSGGSTGGSSSSSTKGSDLVTKLEDTSKTAKHGGSMKWLAASEPLHFDGQAQGQVQLNVLNGLAYNGLVANKPGTAMPSTWTDVVPDLATSWEFSPDGLTLTFKLRDGLKWQNKAPVNGRALDSSDVVENWNRWIGKTGNNAAATANSLNPSSPILGVSAPDAKTVVYKMKEPTSFILQRFANLITGELGTIAPKEASSGFDMRKDQLGAGAYILDKYEPSVRLTYKRNPDYWNKDAAYPDELDIPFILTSQYPTQVAQFSTGAVYAIPLTGGLPGIQAQDIVSIKKQAPAINMYSYTPATNSPGAVMGFGWLPGADGKKSPFLDVRVRQAISMSMDRDAYIDTFSNVSAFQKEGLPVDTYEFTSIAYIPGVTLDPRKSDFGENAKYYKQDIAGAKQLLSAAGYANGFEFASHFVGSGNFGPAYTKQVEVMNEFMRGIGLKPNPDPVDYNLKYLPNYILTRGKHDGIIFRIGAVTSPSPVDFFVWRYYSTSTTSGALGYDVNGTGDQSGDPAVDAFIDKAKAETDSKKQISILGDLQRYLGKMQYSVTNPGTADTFLMAWPAVKNYAVFQGDSRAINDYYYNWWLDDTQAPLKKS